MAPLKCTFHYYYFSAEVRFLKICDYWAFYKYWYCFEDHWWTGKYNLKTFIFRKYFQYFIQKTKCKTIAPRNGIIFGMFLWIPFPLHKSESHKQKLNEFSFISVTNSDYYVAEDHNKILFWIIYSILTPLCSKLLYIIFWDSPCVSSIKHELVTLFLLVVRKDKNF